MKHRPCPITPPVEFGKPKPSRCPGKVYLYDTGADEYERCDTCKAVWSRDSKDSSPFLDAT